MPAFIVSVVDWEGKTQSLREDAPTEARLREILQARRLWPVTVRPLGPDRRLARLVLPTSEFVALLHQLELQLTAGITADVALRQLASDASGPARAMLEKIHVAVSEGEPIHAACRFFHRQFPTHVAAIIAAGEMSAQLPAALRAVAEHLTNVDGLRKTARRALIYPVVVLSAMFALVVFLVGGVVPQFAAIFDSLHLALPAPTRFLIATSALVRARWLFLAAVVVLGMSASALMSGVPRGRRYLDAAILRVPVLGDTVRNLATARFAAHVRLLHEAGIPLLEALTTGAELTGNAILAEDVLTAREGVARGQAFHSALPRTSSWPRFVAPALKAGETSGQLGAALRHIEAYAAAAAREKLSTLLALLEPTLIAALTGIVGFIALSFFLPLFQMMGGIR